MRPLLTLIPIILAPFVIGLAIAGTEKKPETGKQFKLNPDHLDGAFTGGFGEETCRSCHFDYDINPEGGSLNISGIPDTPKPGKDYEITVTVQSDHLEVGGFQMTARFEDGTQAGEFLWEGDRLMFTPSVTDSIQYLQHSREGTSPNGKREVSWAFIWKAPNLVLGDVLFHIAANAGNHDDSSFGDWIYAEEIITKQ